MKEICLTCEKLKRCSDASVKMLQEGRGCGSWSSADPNEVAARSRAIGVAGYRALEALINQSPPKAG
jgi:hypothetical protein